MTTKGNACLVDAIVEDIPTESMRILRRDGTVGSFAKTKILTHSALLTEDFRLGIGAAYQLSTLVEIRRLEAPCWMVGGSGFMRRRPARSCEGYHRPWVEVL
jgi:hypothetical protein